MFFFTKLRYNIYIVNLNRMFYMKALEIFMTFALLFPFLVYLLNKWYIKRNLEKGNMKAVAEGKRNIETLKKLFFTLLIIVTLVFISIIVFIIDSK